MSTVTPTRSRRWAAPRSHGIASGLALLLLGAWGAIIPFVGPYFDYAYSPNTTWTWTAGRGYLEVLPGAVAFVAGLALLMTAHRATASIAAWFGVLAGAWFVVGPVLTPLWSATDLGTPVGGTRMTAVEQIGMFYGLGAAIILFAAAALGRYSVATLRDEALATERTATPAPMTPAPMTPPAAAAPRDPAMLGGEPTRQYPAPGPAAAPVYSGQPSGAEMPNGATGNDGMPQGRRHSWLPGRHRHHYAH